MKHIKLKNIIYSLLGAGLGLALFISFSGAATATPLSSGLQAFQMTPKPHRPNLDTPYSVLNNSNENALFRLKGTSVLGNMLSFGQTRFHELALGYPDQNVPGTALSVNGTITIKELADPARGDALVPACVNDFGVINVCPAASFSCTGTAPSDAQLCSGDDTGLSADTQVSLVASCDTAKCEYTCNSGFHKDGDSCVANTTP